MLQLDAPCIFTFTVTNLLADESALRSTWSVKGASGIKPCMLCKNVVQKGTLVGQLHNYLKEITSVGPFDGMSDSDWYELADHLTTQQARCTKGQLETLEKSAGLNWNPCGLMYDNEMRQKIPPTSSTFDSMHVYFNHGCASNETHLFLDAAETKCGLTYKVIHAYMVAAKWKAPSFQQSIDPARVFTEVGS